MSPDPLLNALLALTTETEWVEFKQNNHSPEEIGEYLSALANAAALHGREAGYLVWGIEDRTHREVGTTTQPRSMRIGAEALETWLARLLSPRVDFRFYEWERHGQRMVLLRVQPAVGSPVAFQGTEWIRIGSHKKKLREYPGKERELWRVLSHLSFEIGIAATGASGGDVLESLDYPKYFELSGQKLPVSRSGVLERLAVDCLIVRKGEDQYDITNLGGILFAKRLGQMGGLGRKALRVIRYKGSSRVETEHEKPAISGYAAGFEEMVSYINDQLPRNEVLGAALRKDVRMYPERAIRELVANAMIHQDFCMRGTGPMVEIFDDRLEVSNPGLPLIDKWRFLDHSPRSRNEKLADLMRRLGICEERGSGFDKVVFDIEYCQLPAPDVGIDETHTRVTLFAQRELAKMDKRDRVRSCYLHSCLLHVSNKVMTNTTLRERFRIDEDNYPVASRIIRDTVNSGLVKLEDPTSKSKKHARYVPFWA
jgi:ATP-dependent DNA helicase RecG